MENKRFPFVIGGNYSEEFLKEMGYTRFIPPLVNVSNDTPAILKMMPVKLAYELNIDFPK